MSALPGRPVRFRATAAGLVSRSAWLGIIISAVGCGVAGIGSGSPMAGSLHRDRVEIGAYGEIVGMAASQRMIFVASPSGLAVYDRVSQQWLPPLTPADGYPAERVTALVGDPEVEGVWIGTLGEVLFYRPAIDQLIRTVVGTRVDRIIFDRADPAAGAYIGSFASGIAVGEAGSAPGLGRGRPVVQAGDDWVRVTHTGFASRMLAGDVPPPERWVIAPTIESLAERIPALASFADLLTRDEAMRSWRPTSATQVPGMSEVWLGTRGGGVYLADPLFSRARHVPFGLFEPGVSALALASDGVWAASLGIEPRGTGGVTFASADLQQWRWMRGPADGALAGLAIRDMLVRDGSLWVATDRGVAHRDLRGREGGGASPEWRWIAGARRAFALGIVGTDVWAGTDEGLLPVGPVDASGVAMRTPVGAGRPVGGGQVRALMGIGDSLWLGSASGLAVMRMHDGVPTITRLALAGAPVWLQAPVVAMARSDSVAVVATVSRVAAVDLRSLAVSVLPGDPDLSRIGRLISLAVDARTIWVGGERGAMVIGRTTGLARSANVPGFGAEPVFDIALEPDFAWLATPTGLVRVRRLPDGGVR